MKEEQDYTRDIVEIRSMMERSSKFLLLSGWAGILAGVLALAGAYLAYTNFDFNPDDIIYTTHGKGTSLLYLALVILILAGSSAFMFSYKKAEKRGEKIWNPTSRRLLFHMAVPFLTGGLLCLTLIAKGMIGWVAPITLIFYGLSLFNASKFTYQEVKILGFIELALGLLSAYRVEYSLLCWALGFGLAHIIYGIYMHYKYER